MSSQAVGEHAAAKLAQRPYLLALDRDHALKIEEAVLDAVLTV